MQPADDPTSRPPRRPRHARKWLPRFVIFTTLFILALMISVQLVLWSDLPRRLAIAQIQNQIGAQTSIDSFSVSWFGNTRLDGVTVTLPLAESPAVRIDQVRVEHAWLPILAFTRRVNTITLHGAEIDVRELPSGRWNLQQFARNSPNQSEPASSPPDLPEIIVRDAAITITRADGRRAEIREANLVGKRSGLTYEVSGGVGKTISASSQISLAGGLQHQLNLEVHEVPAGLEQLTGRIPSPLAVNVEWSGRKTSAGIEGNLHIVHAKANATTASGFARISTAGNRRVRITPINLELFTSVRGIGRMILESGTIDFGNTIRLEQISARLGGGRVAIRGEVNPETLSGTLEMAWQQIQQAGIRTTGTAQLDVKRELTGELAGQAVLTGTLVTPGGGATGTVAISGKGRSLAEFDSTVSSEPFTLHPNQGSPISVPAIVGQIRGRGSRIVMESLRPRDAHAGEFLATAEVNRELQEWWGSLHARQLDLSHLKFTGLKKPLDVNIEVDGNWSRVNVRQFYLQCGKTTLYAAGLYDAGVTKPVKLDTWTWYSPEREPDEDASFEGLHARCTFEGTLNPRLLSGSGSVDARNLVIQNRILGNISLDFVSQLTESNATFSTAEMELLKGEWQMTGEWAAFTEDPPKVTITWKDLSLSALANVAKLRDIEGTISSGHTVLEIPSFRLRDWSMLSHVQAKNVKCRGLVVDSADIHTTLAEGEIVSKPVLRSGDGTVTAQVDATTAIADPIRLSAKIDRWPAPAFADAGWATDLTASVDGDVAATYSISAREATASANLNGTIHRQDEIAGSINLSANLQKTRLQVDRFQLQTLEGTAEATAAVELADLETLRADLIFNRLRPSQLAWITPALADVAGQYTGALRVAEATAERPLGPVRIEFTLSPQSGGFKTIGIGNARITAYAAYKSPTEWRIVTDEAELSLAGGKVKPFARVSTRPGRLPTQLLTADLAALQLAPIVRAFKNDGQEIVGEVTGEIRVFGSTRSLDKLSAEADIWLTNSDLANFGPVAAMYNVLHIGGGSQPTGSGHISLRMEDGNVTIPIAYYFNRGAYINGFGTVSDVSKFPHSPLDLTLFGSARPLRDINLPLFADADKLFSVIQSAGTTIHATGTLYAPQARQVAFQELGQTVQGVLLGRIKEEKAPP